MCRPELICHLFCNKWRSARWAKVALCWLLCLKNSIKVFEISSNTVVKFDLLYSMWLSSSVIQIMLGAALWRMRSPVTRTMVTSSRPPTLCSYSSRWVPSTATLNMSSSTRIFSCRESNRNFMHSKPSYYGYCEWSWNKLIVSGTRLCSRDCMTYF